MPTSELSLNSDSNSEARLTWKYFYCSPSVNLICDFVLLLFTPLACLFADDGGGKGVTKTETVVGSHTELVMVEKFS